MIFVLTFISARKRYDCNGEFLLDDGDWIGFDIMLLRIPLLVQMISSCVERVFAGGGHSLMCPYNLVFTKVSTFALVTVVVVGVMPEMVN